MTSNHFDAIVIGAGQAGVPLATAFADAGRRTALIERADVGGTCVNVGCTPTKTMVASARTAYLARRAADYGVGTGEIDVDMIAVRDRKRAIVNRFRRGSERRVTNRPNLDYFEGDARLTGPHAIAVRLNDEHEEREFTTDLLFLNVGSRPRRPDLEGLDSVPSLDSTSIMELAEVPEHLLVLGGGYVGLEFAQMFRRFGSAVTVIQRGPQLLGREDEDVAEAVAAIFREDGIELLLASRPIRVEPVGGGVRMVVRTQDGQSEVEGSHLLVATGRTPNTDGLGLEAAGIEMDDRGYIVVNERLETNVPGVYALGEVNGEPAFTHIAYDDYRIAIANLLDGAARTIHDRPVPYTVYIDPQLGRVGPTEKEARNQERAIKIATMPMSSVARARQVDETRGMMKVLVDADNDQILGAAILGIEGGEIMSMLQIAMMGHVPYTELRDAVFAHPTLAESLNNLFSTLDR
jgi:pyruvate/2-oxoglutarate dehydrogenase complex dihydrolipoamide dehydrogenase (E3) component